MGNSILGSDVIHFVAVCLCLHVLFFIFIEYKAYLIKKKALSELLLAVLDLNYCQIMSEYSLNGCLCSLAVNYVQLVKLIFIL